MGVEWNRIEMWVRYQCLGLVTGVIYSGWNSMVSMARTGTTKDEADNDVRATKQILVRHEKEKESPGERLNLNLTGKRE